MGVAAAESSPRGETLFGISQCPKSSNTRSGCCLAWPVPGVVPCTNARCWDLIQMHPSGSVGQLQAVSAAGALWGCSPRCVRCPRLHAMVRLMAACEDTAVTSVPPQPGQGTQHMEQGHSRTGSVCHEKGSGFCPGNHDEPAEFGLM